MQCPAKIKGLAMKTSKLNADNTRGFSKRLVLFVMLCLPTGLIAQENSHAIAVRNQVAQQESPVTTLRHWKITKGGFDRFLKASQDGIWPYFEKIGARVVGMWVVLDVVSTDKIGDLGSAYKVLTENDKDYDEVYLLTRYASLDHWQATRNPTLMGGNGPDFDSLVEALKIRGELTIDSDVTFLQGFHGPNSPYFLPGTGEEFQLINPER
jgi:hypothetical protein